MLVMPSTYVSFKQSLAIASTARNPSRLLSVALVLCILLLAITPARAANTTVFCKCHCPPNSAILTVSACNQCSKDFCVERGACFRPVVEPLPTLTSALPSATPAAGEPVVDPTDTWKVECYRKSGELACSAGLAALAHHRVYASRQNRAWKLQG
ncbi:hypothetical protein BDZ88DRAFT_427063 [Geranomyces variabilis]|nr:hypothetical protein BDZ88DRAFT_427063 [Geranomyces variabilis]